MEKHHIIDMHTHSTASDGDMNPNELLSYAKEKGIEIMSLTDHDTLLGDKSLTTEDKSDLTFINGIELSAKVKYGRMHILGYDIDLNSHRLNESMEELHDNSVYAVISYLNQLKIDYGIEFSEKDVIDLLTTNKNIGRPDIAKLCINYGYASNVQEAFDKYLIDIYAKTRNNNKGIKPQECIDLIQSAGGIPVIAHPHSLLQSKIELINTMRELKGYGLKGIEVFHSHHDKEQRKEYMKIAIGLNLLISGGTDFHGFSVKPEIDIGSGIDNNIDIKKLTLLDYINHRK